MPELITISDAGAGAQAELKGPTAQRMLEISRKLLADGKRGLALAWAVRARKRAEQEGNSFLVAEADRIIIPIRAEIQAKAGFMAMVGDISTLSDHGIITAEIATINARLTEAVAAVREGDQASAYDIVDDAWDDLRKVLRKVWAVRIIEKKEMPEVLPEIKKTVLRFVNLFIVLK